MYVDKKEREKERKGERKRKEGRKRKGERERRNEGRREEGRYQGGKLVGVCVKTMLKASQTHFPRVRIKFKSHIKRVSFESPGLGS